MKRLAPFVLLAGDLLALLLFVFFGQRDHELINPENPLLGIGSTGVLFLVPWVAAGWLLGAYSDWTAAARSKDDDGVMARSGFPYRLVTRAINAWLVAAPLAVLLRSFVLGRAVIPTIFLVVVLSVGGAFVIGWRLLFAVGWKMAQRQGRKKAAETSYTA